MQNYYDKFITFLRHNKAHNITLAVAILVAGISYFLLIKTEGTGSHQETALQQSASANNTEKNEFGSREMAVDISGAVNKPGVYYFPEGSRLYEAIKRAGGLSEKADKHFIYKDINHASILTDQQKIYIPSFDEIESEQDSVQMTDGGSTNSPDSAGISINNADESELDSLPGIGPISARKIIDNRPYTTIRELTDKKIITSSVFDKVKELIAL